MTHPTTLEEALRMQLEVTFLATALEAEEHATKLLKHGRRVVSVFEETLTGASKPLHLVCVERAKHVLGPQGLERKR